MSTAIPPAPPPVPSSSTGGSGPVTVAVVANGAAVADLADGAMVEAVAQARAAKGIIEALTAKGLVQLKANAPLPPIPEGSALLLQVLNKDGEAQLRLLAVNGRPLAGGALPGPLQPGIAQPGYIGLNPPGFTPPGFTPPGLAQPGLAPFSPAQPGLAQPGLAPLPGQPVILPGAAAQLGLTATIIRPAITPGTAPAPAGALAGQPGALTGGLALDLPAGTQVTVRIASVGMAVPETATPVPGQTLPPGQLPTGQPAAAGTPAAPLPPGMTAPAVPASPSPLLSGTVTTQPPGGNALVQTPVGTLSVPAQMELPAGTRLTLEVVGKPLPPPPAMAPAPSKPEGLTAQGWPALTQALDALSAGNQTQAVDQLMRAIPQAGPRLAASMAMFGGALRTGEPRSLVPESAVRGLEKAGKKELAQRLMGDLGALGDDAARPVGNGEWRGITMPFLNGTVVDPIQLFIRQTDADGSRRKAGGTGNDERFVVDLRLTQLGRLQLDGLVRREDKLFDLIIRTDAPLPLEARRDILGIFANSSELVGTKGSVSFQSGGRWVEFPPAPPPPTRIEV